VIHTPCIAGVLEVKELDPVIYLSNKIEMLKIAKFSSKKATEQEDYNSKQEVMWFEDFCSHV